MRASAGVPKSLSRIDLRPIRREPPLSEPPQLRWRDAEGAKPHKAHGRDTVTPGGLA